MLWNSGLPISLALFVAVHIANLRYMRWSADMEANEALWWLDAGVRIVRALLYGAAVIAIVASAVLFAPISYFAGASGLFSGEVTPHASRRPLVEAGCHDDRTARGARARWTSSSS